MTQSKAADRDKLDMEWLKVSAANPANGRETYSFAYADEGVTMSTDGYRVHVVKRDLLDGKPNRALYKHKHLLAMDTAPKWRSPTILMTLNETHLMVEFNRVELVDAVNWIQKQVTDSKWQTDTERIVLNFVNTFAVAFGSSPLHFVVRRDLHSADIIWMSEKAKEQVTATVFMSVKYLAAALSGFTKDLITLQFGANRIVIEDDERLAVIMNQHGAQRDQGADIIPGVDMQHVYTNAAGWLNDGEAAARRSAQPEQAPLPPGDWFKVLVNGKSCHGGSHHWELPKQHKDGSYSPGKWQSIDQQPVVCTSGFHATQEPYDSWAKWKMDVYLLEGAGRYDPHGDPTDRGYKVSWEKVRLLSKVEPPDWWTAAHEFVDSIQTLELFSFSGPIDPRWRFAERKNIQEAIVALGDWYDGATVDQREFSWHDLTNELLGAAKELKRFKAADTAAEAARDTMLQQKVDRANLVVSSSHVNLDAPTSSFPVFAKWKAILTTIGPEGAALVEARQPGAVEFIESGWRAIVGGYYLAEQTGSLLLVYSIKP